MYTNPDRRRWEILVLCFLLTFIYSICSSYRRFSGTEKGSGFGLRASGFGLRTSDFGLRTLFQNGDNMIFEKTVARRVVGEVTIYSKKRKLKNDQIEIDEKPFVLQRHEGRRPEAGVEVEAGAEAGAGVRADRSG